MNVLIVSGIWPPEVGGPASHAPDLGRFLQDRGHTVSAMVSGGPDAEPAPFPLRVSRNDRSRYLRIPAGAWDVFAAAQHADVIYATGIYHRSALASLTRRIPLIIKLASDPAYERARSLGLFHGPIEEFETSDGLKVETLRRLRRRVLTRPRTVIIPSRHVAATAMEWGVPEQRIRVIPNPAPEIDASVDRDEVRRQLGVEGPTFAFAGRLVQAKNLPLLIAALRSVPGCQLVLVGDGPELETVESAIATAGVGDRVRLTGALPRAEALQWMRAADAAVLSSDRENFPHLAVEALAAGTPLIGTAVGGVPEIITSGVDGLLVERRDEDGLAAAMRSVIDDPALLARLRAGALESAARYSRPQLYSEIEGVLEAAVASTNSATASA